MKSNRTKFFWRARVSLGALLLLGACTIAQAGNTNGVAFYDANCALCHQRAGVGVRGQFPRLAGRVGEIAATPAGRTYLIEVMLFGIAGKVDIDDVPLIGVMPPLSMHSDEELAAVLNYVIGLEGPDKKKAKGKRPVIAAADLAKVRAGAPLSPGQVLANRAGALPKQTK